MSPNEAYTMCWWTLPNGSRFICTAAIYNNKLSITSHFGCFASGVYARFISSCAGLLSSSEQPAKILKLLTVEPLDLVLGSRHAIFFLFTIALV